MNMMKRLAISLFLGMSLTTLPSRAADPKPVTHDPLRADSRLELYNEYIATYADLFPSYRTEITIGVNEAESPKPPLRIARNDVVGAYTYRPKRYVELSPQEQAALENDEKFLAFRERKLKEDKIEVQTIERGQLVEARKLVEGSTDAWETAGVATTLNVRIDPDDLLSSKPLVFEEPGTITTKSKN